MGIGFILPGTGPGTGPILPQPLHGYGRNDAIARYTGLRLETGDSGTVQEWRDVIGGNTLSRTDSPGVLELHAIDGVGSGLRRPANPPSGEFSLSATAPRSNVKTAVLVLNTTVAAAGGSIFQSGPSGFDFRRAGNTTLQISGTGGSSGYFAMGGTGGTGLHFIAATVDNLDVSITYDATYGTSTLTSRPASSLLEYLYGGTSSANDETMLELLLFDTTLSSTQLQGIRTALKAAYPTLP